MTDLRKISILGIMGRLNTLIDGEAVFLSPMDVKSCIADGTILDRLRSLYGDYPEFSPGLNKAESILLQQEWKAALDIYSGREAAKMGVSKNGLCLLVGYCIEMLMWRNLRELTG